MITGQEMNLDLIDSVPVSHYVPHMDTDIWC